MDESTRVGDDSKTVVHRTTFDPDSEPITDAVVYSLAQATGTAPEDVEPIEAVVDPIVFDALVRNRRRPFRMCFQYHDHRVTVESHGEITVRRNDYGSEHVREVPFAPDEAPSNAVIRALASVKDLDETEIDPLFPTVDPDAIDALFGRHGTAPDAELRLSFRIDDVRVEITPERSVLVRSVPGTS